MVLAHSQGCLKSRTWWVQNLKVKWASMQIKSFQTTTIKYKKSPTKSTWMIYGWSSWWQMNSKIQKWRKRHLFCWKSSPSNTITKKASRLRKATSLHFSIQLLSSCRFADRSVREASTKSNTSLSFWSSRSLWTSTRRPRPASSTWSCLRSTLRCSTVWNCSIACNNEWCSGQTTFRKST